MAIRPSIESIEFPTKRLSMIENSQIVGERIKLLQAFMRKLTCVVCVNSLHPSTSKILLTLQKFLNVDDKMDSIMLQVSLLLHA